MNDQPANELHGLTKHYGIHHGAEKASFVVEHWIDDVRDKYKRKSQILFAKNSDYLQDLFLLIQKQNHRTMVLWALEFADETVSKLLQRYPDEKRPQQAVIMSRSWAAGKVKMPAAQRAILDAHAFAKEISSPEDIALCHAVGQACGTVHAKGHAIGFPIYELTAIIRHYGIDNCKEPVEERKKQYIERINYWHNNYANYPCEWANFMIKD